MSRVAAVVGPLRYRALQGLYCSLQKQQAKSPVSGVARRSPPTPDLSRSSGSRAVYFPATAKHGRRSHDIASAESRWCSSSKLVLFLACLWPLHAGEKGRCAWEIANWLIYDDCGRKSIESRPFVVVTAVGRKTTAAGTLRGEQKLLKHRFSLVAASLIQSLSISLQMQPV